MALNLNQTSFRRLRNMMFHPSKLYDVPAQARTMCQSWCVFSVAEPWPCQPLTAVPFAGFLHRKVYDHCVRSAAG